MAIVAEGDRRRVYLAPTAEHQEVAATATSEWQPEGEVPARLTGGTCVPYGLSTWGDLFTSRQLVALTTFSDLVGEATRRIQRDAAVGGAARRRPPFARRRRGRDGLRRGGRGVFGAWTSARACRRSELESVSVGTSDAKAGRSICFGRQAVPMVWDYRRIERLLAGPPET